MSGQTVNMDSTVGVTANKKWKTDYSQLLKCWSLIKTSQLLKDKAYEQLKTFQADNRAVQRLNSFINKNDMKSSWDQSITLWNKSIEQFLSQKNYLAAAESMESLAEIEFKYGDKYHKRESLSTLLRASKYYKKADHHKEAVMALKRVITIVELSPKNQMTDIANKYEDCIQLYKILDLPHLATLSRNILNLMNEQNAPICSLNMCQLDTYVGIPVPSRVSTPSTVVNNSDDEEYDDILAQKDLNQWFEEKTIEEQIDNKEWVQQQIRLLEQQNKALFTDREDSVHSSDQISDNISDQTGDQHDSVNDKHNYGSNVQLKCKQLLRKNLRQLIPETSDERKESKVARIEVKAESHVMTNKAMTTQITAIPMPTTSDECEAQSTPTKRKRRLKPKELSEESPEKRLIKLGKKGLEHEFCIDPKWPSERLLCILCDESILCYRWSIVTDHLKGRKHNEFAEAKARKLTQLFNYNNMVYNGQIIPVTNGLTLQTSKCDTFVSQPTTVLSLSYDTDPFLNTCVDTTNGLQLTDGNQQMSTINSNETLLTPPATDTIASSYFTH